MRDFKRILPSIIISAIVIAVILKFFDVKGTLASFSEANLQLLLAVAILGFVWLLVRTVVWRTLLKGKADFKTAFITLMEGYLLNNLLPFRLGELSRAALLSQKTDLKFVEILSTIFVERITDIAFSAIILMAAVPFISGAGDVNQLGVVVLAGVVVFFVVAFIMVKNQSTLLEYLHLKFGHYPKMIIFVDTVIGRLMMGLDIFSDISILFRFIFFMSLNWGIAVVQYFLLVKAFFPQAQVSWGMFALGAAAFGGAIPSLPGGVGTLEGAMGGALVLITANNTASLAVPLFMRLMNYVYCGIFGIYGLTSEGRSLKGIYLSLRNINAGSSSNETE